MRKPLTLLLLIAMVSVACNPIDKKIYWKNGKLKKEGQVFNGKANGLWKFYYETGEKQSETYYKEEVRHGHTVHYWPNGIKKGEGDYFNGELHGKWTVFHDNGKMERQGEMKNGKENGIWKVWDENGQLTIEVAYNDGEIVSQTYFGQPFNK
jgi:antitoxin component YwqK of YwqJK toxin-antitoxin module